mmetsp:Transcript_173458/g.421906  ORF Transcript_173458/g.421906 Transcript_173458/m.421906 type:complete len:240 (+) Transcript_173458:376-1095(+)
MPSAIISLQDESQSTGLVSCVLRLATMSAGSHPGRIGSAVAFIQTVCMGAFMFGKVSSKAADSFSAAGFIKGVWKAPAVFRTFACKAPAFSAMVLSSLMAFSVPPTEKPPGKRQFAIWQTAPEPSFLAASTQRGWSLSFSSPATESINCLPRPAASCIASPRSFTSFRPSSKDMTPAAQSAVYSPSERPAMTEARFTASAFSSLSFSRPASPPMNMAGWQYLVSSSLSSGPFKQMSRMS